MITHGPGLERYLVNGREEMLTYSAALLRVYAGEAVAIYVDGWPTPWVCWLSGGELRATCPTSPKVVPRIEVQRRSVGVHDLEGTP